LFATKKLPDESPGAFEKRQTSKMDRSPARDVTTREVGMMVREAIKRGEQAIAEENGEAHRHAKD
jgi:hypothetical protein